jgi:hypothetical protein
MVVPVCGLAQCRWCSPCRCGCGVGNPALVWLPVDDGRDSLCCVGCRDAVFLGGSLVTSPWFVAVWMAKEHVVGGALNFVDPSVVGVLSRWPDPGRRRAVQDRTGLRANSAALAGGGQRC